MQTIERPPEFSHDRCRFLGVAALSLAAMQLGPIGPAKAQGGPAKPARRRGPSGPPTSGTSPGTWSRR